MLVLKAIKYEFNKIGLAMNLKVIYIFTDVWSALCVYYIDKKMHKKYFFFLFYFITELIKGWPV